MKAEITPSSLKGKIHAPTSKSMAHRLLICAALANGTSIIRGVTPCEDVLATKDVLSALGAEISNIDEYTYKVTGHGKINLPSIPLYCKESGSTLRFIIPIASLSAGKVRIGGASSLMKRPLDVFSDIFKERGLLFDKNGDEVIIDGALTYGEYTVRGDISSQFISGLLFALPLLDGDSTINIIPPFESKSYIDLTILALSIFGINIDADDPLKIKIPGNQQYKAGDFTVEGDYSGTAFLDALNMLGSSVEVLGLSENSMQGDRVYKELYPLLKEGTPTIDIGNCPDLGPILFTLAAAFNGATFNGTKRLKIKESDRALAMAKELRKFGGKIEIFENSVIIEKANLHSPAEMLDGHNDHRVVMSLAVLSTVFGGSIVGAEAISKSYPGFFLDIKKLGAKVKIYD